MPDDGASSRNTQTGRLGLNVPDVMGDSDQWGPLLNENWTALDQALLLDPATGALEEPLTLNASFTHNGPATFNGTATDGAMHIRSIAEWPGVILHIDNGTGGAFVRSNRNGKGRWIVYAGDDAPETGGGNGTNFKISRFDDGGNEIDYPFQIIRATGQVLLNGLVPAVTVPQQIDALTYGVKADFVLLTGTLSFVGNTVTITGHNFIAADIGKNLLLPVGQLGPQIVKIIGTSGNSATVDHGTLFPKNGVTNIVGGTPATPWNVTVASPGLGGSAVGDVLLQPVSDSSAARTRAEP